MDNEKDTSLSVPVQAQLQAGFSSAFQLVDDVVLKNYITRLPSFEVRPLDENAIKNNMRKMSLLHINSQVFLTQLPLPKVQSSQ